MPDSNGPLFFSHISPTDRKTGLIGEHVDRHFQDFFKGQEKRRHRGMLRSVLELPRGV